MIIKTTFDSIAVGTEFIYFGAEFKKIILPNGKVGAISLGTHVVHSDDCKHWNTCQVSVPDEEDTSD